MIHLIATFNYNKIDNKFVPFSHPDMLKISYLHIVRWTTFHVRQ